MIIIDQLTGAIVMVISAIIIGIGAYGVTSSRSLFRQLLSIEVIFNGLLVLVLSLLSFNAIIATYFGIVIISVVSAEVIVVVSILVAYMRESKSVSSEDLEEGGV
ncbi:MAG: NADH-quinone oxidoreductase subunit K [Caldisphaera sp.]|jgi:NADH-quinone oxidoreductase subunit K|uniref:NADH-quinone oxidoreductase subunit K n=1 Tax=Caldisphaera sp. TaxID=2060322 RepID=UPI000CC97DCA|nr:NADH-quinone oxidoreductase subunit K [Caldisphaera sp.]PMP59586.1 MAG: NADH-quinone oxidoreductase subunit K [Caldisphaera sp.]PMP89329.1 MAG: NADH-quinone oxidoreductase subunit K [Caldisphaera sp.]